MLVYRDSYRGLYLYFFGEDGKKRMQLKSFGDFLTGLHDEIVRLEFSHYDFRNQVGPTILQVAIHCINGVLSTSADFIYIHDFRNQVSTSILRVAIQCNIWKTGILSTSADVSNMLSLLGWASPALHISSSCWEGFGLSYHVFCHLQSIHTPSRLSLHQQTKC